MFILISNVIHNYKPTYAYSHLSFFVFQKSKQYKESNTSIQQEWIKKKKIPCEVEE